MSPGDVLEIVKRLGVKHEDVGDGHERLWILGIPVFDSRRVARRIERRKARVELRNKRREGRK